MSKSMIVHRIANTTAGFDRIYLDKNGEESENTELQEILEKPNETQGRNEFYEEVYEYLLTSGNAFIHFIEGVGMGYEMQILNSARMNPSVNVDGDLIGWKYTKNNSNRKRNLDIND